MSPTASTRAYTLVEVMIVVVIVGVLATLGVYGVRKYMASARTSEATSVLNAIRAAEEVHRSDTFVYFDVSGGSFDNKHPSAIPGDFKRNWVGDGDSPATSANFRTLGVQIAGAVSFTYATVAGRAGEGYPALPTNKSVAEFNFPDPATEPYFIAVAQGDLDGNGSFSYVVTHSMNNEIYIENEGR
jgi:type IV pilus assembly protein PilA